VYYYLSEGYDFRKDVESEEDVPCSQGSRKLAPLALPVPDKPHLVGQNEIYMKNDWTYYGKSKDILSYSDKLDIWIFKT
jgi:hypothetical protein